MALYDSFAGLALEVDGYELERSSVDVSTGFTRITTTVVMHGGGEQGRGEDVTYTGEDHDGFPAELPLAGALTFGELSGRLEGRDLFAAAPRMGAARDYRRWAFESAALDLALRQAGTSFAQAAAREARPVRFVVSTRGDVEGWMAADPELEFKLDPEPDTWDAGHIERLAATGRVRVLDLKAYYTGTVVETTPEPEFYRAIVAAFPDAVIEDAWLAGDARSALAGAEERLSFDAPIHSLADVDALSVRPRWLNIKPSRFGTLARLLECIEACEARGVRMYGGGQFELGVGRRQIQTLASTFYAGGPNDTAPGDYNQGDPRPGLPSSPLPAATHIGF